MLEELKKANEYIVSKISENDSHILEMEKFALENNVPIVTKEVAKYLEFLVRTQKVKKALEIGTAIGYSGILILNAMGRDGNLTTIEIDQERYNQAEENFKKTSHDGVQQYLGDANDILPILEKKEKKYDFIFIDASKGQYQKFFEVAYKMLEKDGMIFIDNIMFRGYLYNEYPKRFKTIVTKLDKFIDYLYEEHDFVLLPFGDGVGLISHKQNVIKKIDN